MDTLSSNRKRLLRSALKKKDDIDAFERLYNNYQPRIYSFSLRYLKVTEDAEGITQEVFIELWNNRKKIDVNLSLSSFLFTIAKNKIIDHFRKQQKQILFAKYLQSYIELSKIEPEADADPRFSVKQVGRAIKKLSEKRKIVFLLSKKFGLSRKEIADFMGVSENTVKNHLQEAVKNIREALSSNPEITILLLLFF